MHKNLALLLSIIIGAFVFEAHAAGLLPNGQQQFLDLNGNPLSGGKVYTYVPGTTTPKNTYQNPELTTLNTNPIILDSSGRARIWAAGGAKFRQVVHTSADVLIWDQLAYVAGDISGPAVTVSGNAVTWGDAIGSTLLDAGAPPLLHVKNNTELKALPIASSGTVVIREGFSTAGDGGWVRYKWQATNCPAADDGAQVQPSVTGCWVGDFAGIEPNVKMWGAACDGVTTDSSTAIQAAITANPTGILRISAPGCRINTTLTIGAKVIRLIGDAPQLGQASSSAILYCRTGTTDCIATTTSPVTGLAIERLTIDGTNNTGGAAIALNNARDVLIDRITIEKPYNGITVTGGNTMVISNSRIDSIKGSHGLKWDKNPADGVGDILQLKNTIISCGYNATPSNTPNGIVWDGNTKTLHLTDVGILACNRGLWVQNTRANAAYPQFLQMVNSNIEGAVSNAIRFDSGSWAWISNSYITNLPTAAQGNADTAIIHLGYDSALGASTNFFLTNSKIFAGSAGCMQINWGYVYITNIQTPDCVSAALANTKPAIAIGTTGNDVHISNSTLGSANHNYSVTTEVGTGTVWLKNNDMRGNATSAVLNNSNTLDFANQIQHIFIQVTASTTATVNFIRPFAAAAPIVVCTRGGGSIGGDFHITTVTTTQVTIVQANNATQAYNCLASGY